MKYFSQNKKPLTKREQALIDVPETGLSDTGLRPLSSMLKFFSAD